jgi:hypothetical protein
MMWDKHRVTISLYSDIRRKTDNIYTVLVKYECSYKIPVLFSISSYYLYNNCISLWHALLCLSVHMSTLINLGPVERIFVKFWIGDLKIYKNSGSVKLVYKNIRHFMWRPQYICDNIFTEFSMEWGKFHIKVADKITTHISCQLHCIQKLCHLWDNYTKHDTTRQAVGDINTLWTGDADLRLYITTVQDGWRKSAFLTRWNAVHLQVLLSATPQGKCFQRYRTLKHY